MTWKTLPGFCRQRPWSMPAILFFLTAPLFLTALAAPAAHAATYLKTDSSTSPIESPPWTAYNDLGGDLSTGNVTNISGPGNDRPAGSLSPSGTLVKYSDNSSTGVTLTISGTSGTWNTVHGSIFGLDLDEIGDVSGHGQLFGHLDLGASGTIAGDATGLELFGHVSGSGTISGTTLFGNVNIGSSPGAITLEDVTLSASGTTTFEVAGTDASQFDRLVLLGTVALAGTAQITFDNFVPELTDTFQLLDLAGGTPSSWFSSVVAPEGWVLSSSGTLSVIPEPASLLLAAMSLGGLFFRRGQLFLRG